MQCLGAPGILSPSSSLHTVNNPITYNASLISPFKITSSLKAFNSHPRRIPRSSLNSAIPETGTQISQKKRQQSFTDINNEQTKPEIADVSGRGHVQRCVADGNMEEARRAFEQTPLKSPASWGHIIAGCFQHGSAEEAFRVFCAFWSQAKGEPDQMAFTAAINACSASGEMNEEARQIHGISIKLGIQGYVSVGTALLGYYAKRNQTENVRQVFDRIRNRNVVSWTSIIRAYVKDGDVEEALGLFREMFRWNCMPNAFTFSSVFSGVTSAGFFEKGREIHALVLKLGLESEIGVGTSLVNMYCRNGKVNEGFRAFENLSERNVVAFTAMITGFAQNEGFRHKAVSLLAQMLGSGLKPNYKTLSSALCACCEKEFSEAGRAIHALALKWGLECSVSSALISMYSSSGFISDAELVFDCVASPDDVSSFAAMISAFSANGQCESAVKVFVAMIEKGVQPNEPSLTSVIRACGDLTYLGLGKELHAYVCKTHFQSAVFVQNALISMYVKSGIVESARSVFDKMSYRNLVSWNAMISGYSQHGYGAEALEMFAEMKQQQKELGFGPDDVTMTACLAACANTGLASEGEKYFSSMSEDLQILPSLEHYTCMVDLYGRAGRLDVAEKVISEMPYKPDAFVWRALLSACRIQGNLPVAERAALQLLELEKENPLTYWLLCKIYAASGRLDSYERIKDLMKVRGVNKQLDFSKIEVGNSVYTFVTNDTSHCKIREIYIKLDGYIKQMEESGYVTESKCLWEEEDNAEEEKQHPISYHSELLATMFGLISDSPSRPVRVYKNLRICSNCHNALKFISVICSRKIIVRDSNKFHHFHNGLCSCGDYW